MPRWIFMLQMMLGLTVEVTAANVTGAIAAATQALPHLEAIEHERSLAVSYGDGIAYTLTCLLCSQVNPHIPGRTLLIAMQEHLMGEHGLMLEELINVTSVFHRTPLAGCYIWGSPAHGACFRGARYADTASTPATSYPQHCFAVENLPAHLRLTQTLALRLLDGSPGELSVRLAGVDEDAWYGFLLASSNPSLLVWPKSRWASTSK